MTKVQFKIGMIEETPINNKRKFIVEFDEEKVELIFHSLQMSMHKDIANAVGAKNVLGGGSIMDMRFFHLNEWSLCDFSGDFGGVPNHIIEEFIEELLPFLRKTNPQLEEFELVAEMVDRDTCRRTQTILEDLGLME